MCKMKRYLCFFLLTLYQKMCCFNSMVIFKSIIDHLIKYTSFVVVFLGLDCCVSVILSTLLHILVFQPHAVLENL